MDLKEISAMEKEFTKRMTTFAPMYIYGTEMMSKYYPKLCLKDKKILTVAGSGDPVINAFFQGAKEIISFDLNHLSYFITNLKLEAIRTLTYEEFLRFFGTGKSRPLFEYKLYLKLRKELDKKTLSFFDTLYEYFKFNGLKMGQSSFFRQRSFFKLKPKKINSYLKNKRNYLKTRKILLSNKLTFIQSDVKKIASNKKLKNKKFNVINLSNVPSYFTGGLYKHKVKDPEMYFFEKVLLKLRKLLTKQGILFFYTYSPKIYPNPVTPTRPPISTPKQLKRIKKRNEFKYSEIPFEGVSKGLDKIIVLKRR